MEAGLSTLDKDESHSISSSKLCVPKDCISVELFEKGDEPANFYTWIVGFSKEEEEEESVKSKRSGDSISCGSSPQYVRVMMEHNLLGNLGPSRWVSSESSAGSRSREAPKTPCRTTEDAFQFSVCSDS